MTVAQLITKLQSLPPTQQVEFEFRIKTGYDEGDIYSYTDCRLASHKDKTILSPIKSSLTGGW